MAAATVQTERKGEKLAYEGYFYVSPKLLADDIVKSWRCERKTGDRRCAGRLHENTATGEYSASQAHNHDPEPGRLEALEA